MPKQITANTIVIELSEDSVITEFLNHQKKGTKNTYTSYFRRLKEFTPETTGKDIFDNPNLSRRKIFDFHNYLLEHDYSECYTQSACSMIRGFFSYYDLPLHFSSR